GLEPILFLALGLIWGSTYLAIEIVGTAVGSLTLVAFRLGIGAAILAVAVRSRREPLAPRRAWPHIAVVAITGLVVPFSLIAWSQRDIDAGLASIFNAATPLFTLALAGIFLADEPISIRRIGGVLVGFTGVVVVVGGGIHGGGQPGAMIAMVGAAASFAVTAIWTRRFLHGIRPMTVASGQVQLGFAVVAVLAVVLERPSIAAVPVDAWAAIAWLGVVASGVAPLLFFRLILRWGASRTTVVNYLIPVVGVALGATVLGERLEPSALLGGVIVAAGVALASANPIGPLVGWSARLRPAPIG
ncbi:MAG TPA: DMT family transporter, partial [Candidatus Deferrimicrobium sp.]|nr:DMT family transporter [Candidatus Deferrimicrobium sp.]